MPYRSRRPCASYGCPESVAPPATRCPAHASAPVRVTRIAGRQLQALRRDLFRSQPLCAECVRQGRVTLATERDHVVPLADGGRDEPSNTQGLCKPCHAAKSAREASQRALAWGGYVRGV